VGRQAAKTPRENGVRDPSPEVDALAHRVIGAAIEVHRVLGPAFAESVYENALCHELSLRRIPYERQVAMPVFYKDELVVELKALPSLAPVHLAQVLSYLRATGLELGLLLNFGERHLASGCRRVVLTF
jgi:hypothetical protein